VTPAYHSSSSCSWSGLLPLRGAASGVVVGDSQRPVSRPGHVVCNTHFLLQNSMVLREVPKKPHAAPCTQSPLRGLLLRPVLALQPAKRRRRGDGAPGGKPVSMWASRDFGLGWFRNSWSRRGVWAAAIVMGDELNDNHSQMPFVDRNQEVEALATNRPDQPFAVRIRLRRPDRLKVSGFTMTTASRQFK
jgi:hypothetical protein